MPFAIRPLYLLVIAIVLVFGCEKKRPDLPPGTPLLQQPLQVQFVELPNEALPFWRTEARQKPALLLLSADSLLQPLPEDLRTQARELALSGSPQELRNHGPLRAETLLMPGQALSAALEAKLFSQVTWVLPQTNPEERIDLEATRQSLFASGAIDDYEAQSLEATEGGFRGEIRGVPFEAILSSGLAGVIAETPTYVHLDLTFFAGRYQDEIRTPVFPLVARALSDLRSSGLKVLGVTLSLDSLIGQTPLDLRFIGNLVSEIFTDPALLESRPPAHWELRAKARYLDTFFQPEKVLELYQKMLASRPNDPTIHYALYQAHKLDKEMDAALASLGNAVQGDPAYGYEYMLLAASAYKKGDPVSSAAFYRLARQAFPENPLVKVNLAKALVETGKRVEAEGLIDELQELNWSEAHYPQMKSYLADLLPNRSSHRP